MKTLYMHIGTFKTGTTALQNFFYENREVLLEYGITYPLDKGGIPYSEHLLTWGNAGSIVANENLSCEGKAEEILKLMGDTKYTLISAEHIWFDFANDKAFWDKLNSKEVIVKVIIYLRRQEEYLESLIAQSVEALSYVTGVDEWGDFEFEKIQDESDRKITKEYLHSAHYLAGLDNIAECIGRENVIVKVYDRNNFKQQNIFSDFLDIFGIELTEKFIVRGKEINPSLDQSTLWLKRLINLANRDVCIDEVYNKFYVPLLDIVQEKQLKGMDSSLSENQKEKIRKMFEEENKIVAKQYCGRDELFFLSESKIETKLSQRELVGELVHDAWKLLQKIYPDEGYAIKIVEKAIAEMFAMKNVESVHKVNDVEVEDNVKKLEIINGNLLRQLSDKQQELDAIKNGYSWKLTAPLRKIRRLIFRNK